MKIARWLRLACLLPLLPLANGFGAIASVSAADADKGKRIAQTRCSPCHIVLPNHRQELANSPPFEEIARRNGFDAEMLAY
jgi:cytochrome c2